MSEHDPRCEGTDDAKLLADVQEYGWHVVRVLEKGDTPGWAFSIGLYKNFHHPEIVVGLNEDLMYYLINDIGEEVRKGKTFQVGGLYRDLIESYACTFKPVNQVWYRDFLGYANWFYKNQAIPCCNAFGRTEIVVFRGNRTSMKIGCGRNPYYFAMNESPLAPPICYDRWKVKASRLR